MTIDRRTVLLGLGTGTVVIGAGGYLYLRREPDSGEAAPAETRSASELLTLLAPWGPEAPRSADLIDELGLPTPPNDALAGRCIAMLEDHGAIDFRLLQDDEQQWLAAVLTTLFDNHVARAALLEHPEPGECPGDPTIHTREPT